MTNKYSRTFTSVSCSKNLEFQGGEGREWEGTVFKSLGNKRHLQLYLRKNKNYCNKNNKHTYFNSCKYTFAVPTG